MRRGLTLSRSCAYPCGSAPPWFKAVEPSAASVDLTSRASSECQLARWSLPLQSLGKPYGSAHPGRPGRARGPYDGVASQPGLGPCFRPLKEGLGMEHKVVLRTGRLGLQGEGGKNRHNETPGKFDLKKT